MADLQELGSCSRNRPSGPIRHDGGEQFVERVVNRLLAEDLLGPVNDTLKRYRQRVFNNAPIPVYWSRSRNFGDAMAPQVFAAASGHRPSWVTRRFSGKVVLQGSILGWALAPGDLVWGAGLLKPGRLDIPEGVTFLAIRGPLTGQFIGADVPALYADPGVLAPLLYEPAPSKTYPIGIVPHYLDRAHMESSDPQVLVIDVMRPVREVIHMITSCDVILSSSLHGIVVAEAFDIPAVWVTCGDRLIGGEFKFRDYYLGTNRDPGSPVTWSDGISAAVSQVRDSGIHRGPELLDALARSVLQMAGTDD